MHERWKQNSDWATDVYVTRGAPYVRQGFPAVIQSQLVSDEEISHPRFHQEIARPAGCLHWACGVFSVEDRIWCLPFVRSTEPFALEITQPIAEIARHMARKSCREMTDNGNR